MDVCRSNRSMSKINMGPSPANFGHYGMTQPHMAPRRLTSRYQPFRARNGGWPARYGRLRKAGAIVARTRETADIVGHVKRHGESLQVIEVLRITCTDPERQQGGISQTRSTVSLTVGIYELVTINAHAARIQSTPIREKAWTPTRCDRQRIPAARGSAVRISEGLPGSSNSPSHRRTSMALELLR